MIAHDIITSGPILVDAKYVSNLLGLKISRAYKLIRQINEQQEQQGKITISGRVSLEYLLENFGISIEEEKHE